MILQKFLSPKPKELNLLVKPKKLTKVKICYPTIRNKMQMAR